MFREGRAAPTDRRAPDPRARRPGRVGASGAGRLDDGSSPAVAALPALAPRTGPRPPRPARLNPQGDQGRPKHKTERKEGIGPRVVRDGLQKVAGVGPWRSVCPEARSGRREGTLNCSPRRDCREKEGRTRRAWRDRSRLDGGGGPYGKGVIRPSFLTMRRK